MKQFMRILISLAILATIASVFVEQTAATGQTVTQNAGGAGAGQSGLSPSVDINYETSKPLGATPGSFEASVYLSQSLSAKERGGVIIGNYGGEAPLINFEIYTNYNPRLYWGATASAVTNIVFESVKVPVGEWVQLDIVCEDNDKVSCYVNGELKQTKSAVLPKIVCATPHNIGGDRRSGNAQYFKGHIMNVAVYSRSRTAAEISASYKNGIDAADSGLLGYWDFSKYSGSGEIADISSKGNILKEIKKWFTADALKPDTYDYTVAVVGDTQIITEKYPDKLSLIYRWIADSAAAKKYALPSVSEI